MDWKGRLLLALVGGYSKIKENLLRPLLSRLGTMTATWLMVSMGAAEEPAQLVATGVVAFGCICFDFMMSWINRKDAAVKAVTKLLDRDGVR